MTLEFYDYNADDGLTVHSKAEEAEEEAATVLDRYRERAVAHGEWDWDVECVEYGVVLPLGRARSHPTGAAAEAPEVNHRDYTLAEVEVDAAEFWRELTERAPKLAASLAAAARHAPHTTETSSEGDALALAHEMIPAVLAEIVPAVLRGEVEADLARIPAAILAERARHAAEVEELWRALAAARSMTPEQVAAFREEGRRRAFSNDDEPTVDDLRMQLDVVRQGATEEVAERDRVLSRLRAWSQEHGTTLTPQQADTYGEGMRDAKQQVAAILSGASERQGTIRSNRATREAEKAR